MSNTSRTIQRWLPITGGTHLLTATYDTDNGRLALYLDGTLIIAGMGSLFEWPEVPLLPGPQGDVAVFHAALSADKIAGFFDAAVVEGKQEGPS